MFFILSKVLYFLLVPISWVLILLVLQFFIRSAPLQKKLRILIAVLLIVFSNPFIYRSLVRWWQPPLTQLAADKIYSVGIVLGGMSYFDKYDIGYFGNNADRFIQTANLYHSGKISKVLISGGKGRLLQTEPAEAGFLLKELLRNGVRREDIIIEEQSRTTYENAIYSKQILDSLKLPAPYIVVTSAIHMPRSEKVFKKAGYNNFITYPCDYKVINSRFSLEDTIVPDIKLLSDWQYLIKEMVGVIAYQLTGKA